MARILDFYNKEVVPVLMEKFKYKSKMQAPKLKKIVINIGLGEAKENAKALEIAPIELAAIAGQRPVITRAKKSISNFKLREGMPIGCMVTLRGIRMYEFFDRLINVAIPRIRDFKGIKPNAFDGQGNYNFGMNEQYIFPEIDLDSSDKTRGMNITIVTTASNNTEAKELLTLLGMPFSDKK
ncbi:MAG: 50S ribosomal protein L5 [Elusimicrobiota bacterium]